MRNIVAAASFASIYMEKHGGYSVQRYLHCAHRFKSHPLQALAEAVRSMLCRNQQGFWAPMLGSEGRKEHVRLVLEDLHMATPSFHDNQDSFSCNPLELLRDLLSNRGLWGVERNKLRARFDFLHIMSTALSSSRPNSSPRLLKHFFVISIESPKDSSAHLFSQCIVSHLIVYKPT